MEMGNGNNIFIIIMLLRLLISRCWVTTRVMVYMVGEGVSLTQYFTGPLPNIFKLISVFFLIVRPYKFRYIISITMTKLVCFMGLWPHRVCFFKCVSALCLRSHIYLYVCFFLTASQICSIISNWAAGSSCR